MFHALFLVVAYWESQTINSVAFTLVVNAMCHVVSALGCLAMFVPELPLTSPFTKLTQKCVLSVMS